MQAPRHTYGFVVCAGLVVGLALGGCDNPDPEGRFDDYVGRTQDRRNLGGGDEGCDTPGQRVDFSGSYFLAIKPSPFPTRILYFQAEVTADAAAGSFDISFQPLRTDALVDGTARENPRTPVGAAIEVMGVPFAEDGTFTINLDGAMVDGEANPITGSPILADLVLEGTVVSGDLFFGAAGGMVIEPSAIDLTGSSFGTVKTNDPTSVEPASGCEAAAPNNGENNGENNENNGENNGENNENNGEPMGPTPGVRCVADVFAGSYMVQFITSTQRAGNEDPSMVRLVLEASADPMVCYTGRVESLTDDSVLGQVMSFTEEEGALTLVTDIAVPPREGLLPEGGRAVITLPAASWSPDGFCGAMEFKLVEPFELVNAGDFAAVREGAAGLTLGGPTCADIARAEPCAEGAVEGEFELYFMTLSGGSNLLLNLRPDALSCVGGELLSKTTEGLQLGRVAGVTDVEGARVLTIRNFLIPPGSNPLLPNGAVADMSLTIAQQGEGSLCGDIRVAVFKDIMIASNGTFNIVPKGQEAEPKCAE
jgi:hypothetical protein